MLASDQDWLGFCRRAAHAAKAAVAGFATTAERGVETGRGEGGDTALVIDRAAEDAVFGELEALGVGLVAVSEERGEVQLGGGGPVRVVIDPVDGSLNAKRGLPSACVSIAVASGPAMADVEVGYVAELDRDRDWWAVRGEGAFCGGDSPRAAGAGAIGGPGPGDRAPGSGGRAGRGHRGIGSAPPARARLGGHQPLFGGRRPPRRDGHDGRDPLGRRGGRPAAGHRGGRRGGAAGRGRARPARCARALVAARDPELLERLRRSFSGGVGPSDARMRH